MFRYYFNIRIILTVALMHFALATAADDSSKKENSSKEKYSENVLNAKVKRNVQELSGSSSATNKLKGRQAPCPPPSMPCPPRVYRTYDGTCNNLNNPFWGSTFIPYRRILPPQYGSGYTPRGTGQTPPLPNSRKVSVGMTNTLTPFSPNDITLMVMQWGQFVDHDMVFTSNEADQGYDGSNCCSNFHDPNPVTPNCQPIDVTDDPFYQQHNVQCLPFIRSTASPCFPVREQTNEVTAYLDASHVYGSSIPDLNNLRGPPPSMLKSGPGNECPSGCNFNFLPERMDPLGNIEFFAGDRRVEIQPGLTSLHTLFVRMHNDINTKLMAQNESYSIDDAFEETRKIIGALMQKITYDEFLPIVLGNTIMNDYDLNLHHGSFFTGYDSTVDASATNVFAASSFRFGHSLIGNDFKLPGGVNVYLAESYNDHSRTTFPNTFPSHFLKGICTEPSEQMDQILVDAIQNKLLAVAPFQFGSDLYARNIERGRDHGLSSYKNWVAECGGGQINTFNDLYALMPTAVVNEFDLLYSGDINGIDLYPAGLAENPIPGGLIGPSFACLNARHFHDLKYGDRFWFENPEVFNMNQLQSIQDTTLSSIICKYTTTQTLQERVMLQPSASNPFENCSVLQQQGIFNGIFLYW